MELYKSRQRMSSMTNICALWVNQLNLYLYQNKLGKLNMMFVVLKIRENPFKPGVHLFMQYKSYEKLGLSNFSGSTLMFLDSNWRTVWA